MTAAPAEQRVTPLELFFDLVFVFALTQVTAMLADDATAGGLLRGLLILAALWWAWSAFAWLTNTVDANGNRERLVMFAAMAAMLVAALAVPHAFGGDAVAFAVAYLLVRLAHIGLFLVDAADAGHRRAILRFTPTSILGPALLIVGAVAGGDAQIALFAAGLAIDIAGPYLSGTRDWRLSPGHFAERYGLIMIIALGESIVALGIGAEGLPVDWEIVAAAVLGVTVSAGLWWLYFDVMAVVAERTLHGLAGMEQLRLARDAYSYLHFPMIAGIVLFALGVKKTLEHVDEPLKTVEAFALTGGVALYLVAHVAFRLRVRGTINPQRLGAAALLLALTPLVTELDALVSLALVAVVVAALVAFEVVHHAAWRAEVRAGQSVA